MTETEKFLSNFEQKRKNGLQDIKFCVEDGDSLAVEDLHAASNRLDQAIADGRSVRLNEWQRDLATASWDALA